MSKRIQKQIIIALRERALHDADEELAKLLTSAADALSHQTAEDERNDAPQTSSGSNFYVSLGDVPPDPFGWYKSR